MRTSRLRYRRVGVSAALATLVVVTLLVSVPAPAHAAGPTVTPAQTSGGVTYTVTWNNADVSSASSLSSAMSISLTQSANVIFYWNVSNGATPVTIKDARLQMYYLGFAVATRDQVLTAPTPGSGSIPLSWTPISVAYLIEGAYRIMASFIAPNGTTMWSENFWVRGEAAYGIAAILPIVLIILLVYEVYGLARSGRYAAIGMKPEAPPPAAPPSEETAPPAPPPAGDSDVSTTPAPPDGEAPPTGGSS